eukprot:Gb_13485 [translate_table: standard]
MSVAPPLLVAPQFIHNCLKLNGSATASNPCFSSLAVCPFSSSFRSLMFLFFVSKSVLVFWLCFPSWRTCRVLLLVVHARPLLYFSSLLFPSKSSAPCCSPCFFFFSYALLPMHKNITLFPHGYLLQMHSSSSSNLLPVCVAKKLPCATKLGCFPSIGPAHYIPR